MASGNVVRIKALLDDKVSSGLAKIKDNFTKLDKSKGAKSVLQGVGVGVGISAYGMLSSAIGTVTDTIGASIDAARDMRETLNKSTTVFGTAAGKIERFGDTTAESLGISKQAAIDAAAGFGFMFTNLGQSSDAAAVMSRNLVTAAGDLASFNNIATDDALEKLRSGLSGEAEPLRAVGIFLSEAKVKAKGLEMGLGNLKGELSEGEKVMARYNIILEDMGVQAGDANRTIDELAGQQKVTTAMLKDAQAELGEAFLETELKVTQLQTLILKFPENFQQAINDGFGPMGRALREQQENWVEYSDSAAFAAEKADAPIDKIASKVRLLSHVIGTETQEAKDAFTTFVDGLVTEAERLISQAFDPIQAEYELTQLIAAETAAEVAASAKGAGLEQEAALASAREAQALHLLEMTRAGQTSSEAYATGLKDLRQNIKDAKGPAKIALQEMYDAIIRVKNVGKTIPVNIVVNTLLGQMNIPIGTKAKGGPASGLTIVGEEGPELVNLPAGSYVHDNTSTMAMLAGGGSSVGGRGVAGGGGLTVNFNSVWPPTREQMSDIVTALDQAQYSAVQFAAPTSGRV